VLEKCKVFAPVIYICVLGYLLYLLKISESLSVINSNYGINFVNLRIFVKLRGSTIFRFSDYVLPHNAFLIDLVIHVSCSIKNVWGRYLI
jgi:hypothetical protein